MPVDPGVRGVPGWRPEGGGEPALDPEVEEGVVASIADILEKVGLCFSAKIKDVCRSRMSNGEKRGFVRGYREVRGGLQMLGEVGRGEAVRAVEVDEP